MYGSDTVTVSLQWLQLLDATNYTITIRPVGTSQSRCQTVTDTMISVDALNYNIIYEAELVGNNCAGSGPPAEINNLLFGNDL